MSRRKERNRRGFIVEHGIIVLFIVSLLVPICVMCLKSLTRYDEQYQYLQDQIGILQLRRVLVCAQDVKINGNELLFNDNHELRTVYLVNNHIAIKPGSLFVMVDIDDCYFTSEGNLIYLNYKRKGEVYKEVIANV